MGSLQLSWTPEPPSQACTPANLEKQLMVSFSGDPQGPSSLHSVCPSLIFPLCATPDPLVLQSQVSSACDQAWVSDTLEWEGKLEAAEALVALGKSSWAPPEAVPLRQPRSPFPLERRTPASQPLAMTQDSQLHFTAYWTSGVHLLDIKAQKKRPH